MVDVASLAPALLLVVAVEMAIPLLFLLGVHARTRSRPKAKRRRAAPAASPRVEPAPKAEAAPKAEPVPKAEPRPPPVPVPRIDPLDLRLKAAAEEIGVSVSSIQSWVREEKLRASRETSDRKYYRMLLELERPKVEGEA